MLRSAALLLCIFLGLSGYAQNLDFARTFIDSLCHADLHGRSWYGDGEQKAANLIESEFRAAGLEAFEEGYQQKFSLALNAFPGKVELTIGKKILTPGKDFLLMPYSGGGSGSFSIVRIHQGNLGNYIRSNGTFNPAGLKGRLVLIDSRGIEDQKQQRALEGLVFQLPEVAGVILLEAKKLTYGKSKKAVPFPVFRILSSAFPKKWKKASFSVEQRLVSDYESQNVVGFVKGTEQPDSFVVFSAHYDHLGRMGDATFFPGANDNGSGTALLVDLARHFAKHPMRYTVVFMAFGAEEIGLVGSEYYCNHPFFSMDKIRFLMNIDLMGNGEDGITVVNGKVFKQEFDLLVQLNEANQWVTSIKSRGKAANSDHYHFSEKGVPAFFIYTRGKNPAYHDLDDHPGNIGLFKYDELFEMMVQFISSV